MDYRAVGVIIVAAIVVGSLVGWGFELVLLQILAPVLPKVYLMRALCHGYGRLALYYSSRY